MRPHGGRCRGALGPDKPLTVKMRIGWDAEQLTGVAVARQCEANGADLIAVHGRTRGADVHPAH